MFKFILLCYLLYFGINSIFVDYIDNKTKFKPKNKENNMIDVKYRWLFIFVGLPCLLFTKKIKKYRKIYYYTSKLKNYENFKKWKMLIYGDYEEEIIRIKRYLKLEKLDK